MGKIWPYIHFQISCKIKNQMKKRQKQLQEGNSGISSIQYPVKTISNISTLSEWNASGRATSYFVVSKLNVPLSELSHQAS